MQDQWQLLRSGKISTLDERSFDFIEENLEAIENLMNETLTNYSDVNDINRMDEKKLAKRALIYTEEDTKY